MGSLLVQTTFGERVEGRFVLQSGKRSSENEVQTTFGLAGKGSSLERPRAYSTHTLHTDSKFCVIVRWCVPEGTRSVGCKLRLATHIDYDCSSKVLSNF